MPMTTLSWFFAMASRLCAALCLLLLPLAGHADGPLVLTQNVRELSAWDAMTFKADASHTLSVQDVLDRLDTFEQPPRRTASFGSRKETMWLRIPLETAGVIDQPWVIDIGYMLNEIDVYLVSAGRVLQQSRLGAREFIDDDSPRSSRTPVTTLDLRADQRYELLIRVRANGPMILPITLRPLTYQAHQALLEQLLQGALNGLALCLLAYSLIQWVGQRERLFGAYALVVLGSAGFSLHFFGIGPQFLWPGNDWLNKHVGIAAGLLSLAGSFLFLPAVLAGNAPHGRYARAMHACAAVTALFCVAYLLGGVGNRAGVAFMTLVSPLPTVFSLPAAIRRMRRGDPIGATLLVAWTVYAVGAVVMASLVQGWVPANFWTLHSFQISATVDMLLFLQVLSLRAQAIRAAAQEALRERDFMHSLAHTDPLTGLSNRRGLQQALHAALLRCSPNRIVALYLMDLDGFKPVNDAYGHDVGDDLLVAVGQRLQAHVRRHTDAVARLGGDEFIIMACDLESPEQAEEIGRGLLHAFEQPFVFGPLHLRIGLTIGYALAPLDSDDPQGLIRLADAAMYAGKQSGKRTMRRNSGELALAS